MLQTILLRPPQLSGAQVRPCPTLRESQSLGQSKLRRLLPFSYPRLLRTSPCGGTPVVSRMTSLGLVRLPLKLQLMIHSNQAAFNAEMEYSQYPRTVAVQLKLFSIR